MLLPMAVRLIAVLIALSTGATGVVPAGDSYRCVFTHQRMAPGEACCPKCEAQPLSIGDPCCELVHGALAEARAPQTVERPRIQPAPLLAILPLPSTIAVDLGPTARNRGLLPHARPPGEQLHQL